MEDTTHKAVAIVGVGAVLPDAPDVQTFWDNIQNGRSSITEVDTDRWDPKTYYDPDPKVPDKTYSIIGGWVREWDWNPLKWRLPIPPRVSDAMDLMQKWAIVSTREALLDYGYPERQIDTERTAVVFGCAMAGEMHYITTLRVNFPEYARELDRASTFASLPEDVRETILKEFHAGIGKALPEITEDTMPGELANIIAGRVANIFNLRGPNYVCDAACASTLAALEAAIDGLIEKDYDVVITGGVDTNMGVSSFVKFCKIGALSATGSRPYANGADGFVMGEGGASFILKRLEDAERDGDNIYAVIRGIGGSSDGKGKGITAPNPVGQILAVQRGWNQAGVKPDTATLMEGHGTSTRVGDVVEVESLSRAFTSYDLSAGSVPLGSVKSNIGHLKGAAGAASLLKCTLALKHKVLPPSINCEELNPNIDFSNSPFFVNTQCRPWDIQEGQIRRAGISAFGFGGTNFHTVLEEYIPGRLSTNGRKAVAVSSTEPTRKSSIRDPFQGALVIGGQSDDEIVARLKKVLEEATAGNAPAPVPPADADLKAPVRLAIDYADAEELANKAERTLKAFASDKPRMWSALRNQGVFLGRGPAGKVAYLYTGQGSQYVNMLKDLRQREPVVANVFTEADEALGDSLGKPLSEYIFVDGDDPDAIVRLEEDLRMTKITQPAVLSTDLALTKMLDLYGIKPDMAMGHSLGEYGALVASGVLSFHDALDAVSARAQAMLDVSLEDNGMMAAVLAPIDEIEGLLKKVDGYVVIANINSSRQAVIGGASKAMEEATAIIRDAGYAVRQISVSHAFHTSIVGDAAEPLRDYLDALELHPPTIPVVANVTGEFYPMHPGVEPQIIEILGKQVASPVQFVKGLNTLYDAGVRVFVEVGPKKALSSFVEDSLGDKPDVSALHTNHPKAGGIVSFNRALCGLWAAGIGVGTMSGQEEIVSKPVTTPAPIIIPQPPAPEAIPVETKPATAPSYLLPSDTRPSTGDDRYLELGHLFADFLDKGMQIYGGQQRPIVSSRTSATADAHIVITGAALGLPGTEKVFDDNNIGRLLDGQQFIDVIPLKLRKAIADKGITRLVKSKNGGGHFETITDPADVIKLAGRGGEFDVTEFGVSDERIPALGQDTKLAIAVGINALRDAGIPLVMRYKTTTTGTKLPERWMLPDELRDDTGVIFASAWPGLDAFADEQKRYYKNKSLRERLEELKGIRARVASGNGSGSMMVQELDRRIHDIQVALEKNPYSLDRRLIFRILAMGHSQFAEFIGARGPNSHVNAACASTTHAVSVADDWIRGGRCRRVIIISADDATSDNLLEWIGSGLLATGAAATDEIVENAALPFDRRRHGMICGMGAAAMVVESREAAQERGIQPICDVISTITANSAFHGTRLDLDHISGVMEALIAQAEEQWGINRSQIAPQTVFVSHETYTPARGGSAQAEINALRHVFGETASQVVMANTKGFTGHAMGVGIEDVLAIKSLETSIVPPVANLKEADPDLGPLNLSKGGVYPVRYALRLGAGFGSQISMSLIRWVPTRDGIHPSPDELGFSYRVTEPDVLKSWLRRISGYEAPELEIVHNTLRVRNDGPSKEVTISSPVSVPSPRPATVMPSTPPVSVPAPQVEAKPAVSQPPVTETAAPEPEISTAPSPAPAVDPVQERVLSLVAETTGYPPDMLELDLDLEADLGIDTVKQAEMFATVREAYNIERDDALQLRDFPTLADVIGFVYDHRPDLKVEQDQTKPIATSSDGAPPAATGVDPVQERVLTMVSDTTGYPADMLELDLDLEADLGIDTVKQAEMFATVREAYDIERDDALQLRDFPTLADVIRFVYEHRPDLESAPVLSTPEPVQEVSSPADVPEDAAALPVTDSVQERILELVSDTTGYPTDMLELDLDLEADLGIDTVKQAEMFAAVREVFDIERDDALQLRDFPTLADVMGFVYSHRPDLAPGSPATLPTPPVVHEEPPADQDQVTGPAGDDVQGKILEIVSDVTGYPIDMLEMDLDLEADLGIDTVKQAEMFATVREAFDIPRDDDLQLRDFPTLGHVVQFAYDRRPDLMVAEAPAVTEAVPQAEEAETVAETAASDTDDVQTQVLKLVEEVTGYPTDMLELDLDLEADLGIDTVKQAEMFAAVRGIFDIPRDEDLQLRDFPTLADVIQFVHDRRPEQVEVSVEETPAVTDGTGQVVPVPTTASDMEAAATVPRRVPVAQVRPGLALFSPSDVTLDSGSRVIVMLDQGGVGKALVSRLEKRGVTVLTIDDTPDADEMVRRLEGWMADGPIQGAYWLPALDDEGPLTEMDLAVWRESLRVRVKLLYTSMRALYDQIGSAGTFLVSATRLGGCHGYDADGASAPLGGPVVGFTKTFKRERPGALVKAVDFEPSRKTAAFADLLIAETLFDTGVVEVGYKNGRRYTISMEEKPLGDQADGLSLDNETTFLVTGAAGSIVSAITNDLAAFSGGTFFLLDLVPEPDPSNEDIQRFINDKDGLKRDLFARIKERGERATPAMVDKELARLERAHAALSAIQAVEAAGGVAHYYSVNLLDGPAVQEVMESIKQKTSRIDVLLHAAGLEISHMLPDKSPVEFNLVFDVKCDGWFNVLHAVGDMPLGATVTFSSIAGRFGNAGQVDYSAANDLLCKTTSSFRTTRPDTRGVSIDWTAWGSIGMASRGSIPKMMELAGIDMLPPEAGIPMVRRELTFTDESTEVIVALSLGSMLESEDRTGGLNLDAVLPEQAGPMAAGLVKYDLYHGLIVESNLDPDEQPFLNDHRIDGTPVLPGVMGVEAFAEAARLLFPDWNIVSIEDVRFLAPFKFYRDEPRTVTVHAGLCQDGEDLLVDCRLTGSRLLPKQSEPVVTTHFTGKVRLAEKPLEEQSGHKPPSVEGAVVETDDIYRIYFHGPAYQVLDRAWRSEDRVIGQQPASLPDNHQPPTLATLAAPRLIEQCFQTAGIGEMGKSGTMGLPEHFDKVSVLRDPATADDPLFAVVTPDVDTGTFDAEVVDKKGNVYVVLYGYATITLPGNVEEAALQPLQAVME